jgi:hypothetical protein
MSGGTELMTTKELRDSESSDAPPLPTYEAPYNPSLDRSGRRLFFFIDQIGFWNGVWKNFRARRGHWPVATITIHYLNHILLIAGVVLFLVYTDGSYWSSRMAWVVGGTLLIAYVIAIRWVKSIAWKCDWNRAARTAEEDSVR